MTATATASAPASKTPKLTTTIISQMLAIHRRLAVHLVSKKAGRKIELQLSNDKDGIEIQLIHYKGEKRGVEFFSIHHYDALALKKANEQAIITYLKSIS